jgi:predicted MFS family arabinose efflux permease
MAEKEKKHKFMDTIKSGIGYISEIISASIFPRIAEGAESIMKNIDDRIKLIEKRILRKISVLMIIWLGCMFLIFSLFFFLREYLNWSNTASFFSIGIIIFVTGLLLKIGESEK